jgi:alkaline phosphatase
MRRSRSQVALALALTLFAGAGAPVSVAAEAASSSSLAGIPSADTGAGDASPEIGTSGESGRPRAVILLIGDGLGFSQISLARYAAKGRGGRLAFESMPVTGLVSIWSTSNFVTDSGAAATAFSSGVKTGNQFIGLDPERRRVRTIGEAAKAAGWRVGYVTNTRITHATPACFYAHHDDRYDEETVAGQLLDADVDLAMGGGLSNFLPLADNGARRDGRNLVAEARQRGIRVLTRNDTPAWNGEGRVIGLFASSHLTYELDDRNYDADRRDPTLADLARAALDGLAGSRSDDRPFFLMVEGGRIDHAGHDFDAAGVVAETLRFDEMAQAVLDWAESRPDILVLLTADHATGGLAINDHAKWNLLAQRTASVSWMTSKIRNAGATTELLDAHTGATDWTDADIEAIRRAPDSYEANRRLGRMLAERDGFTWSARVTDDDTHGHSGEDVPIYARGPGAERFAGTLDNADIALRLADLLGWEIGLSE